MASARTPRAHGAGDAGIEVRLEAVSRRNRPAILALELAQDQKDHLASNAESLAEARRDRGARPRAVVTGDQVVGFLMYDADGDGDGDSEAVLYRFMIDRGQQGRGYGRAALDALVREVEGLGHVRSIRVCYMPDNADARRFYLGYGFVEEGEDEDGELQARLVLAQGRHSE